MRREDLKFVPCVVCGADMLVFHRNHQYCSPRCRAMAYRDRKKKELKAEKVDLFSTYKVVTSPFTTHTVGPNGRPITYDIERGEVREQTIEEMNASNRAAE